MFMLSIFGSLPASSSCPLPLELDPVVIGGLAITAALGITYLLTRTEGCGSCLKGRASPPPLTHAKTEAIFQCLRRFPPKAFFKIDSSVCLRMKLLTRLVQAHHLPALAMATDYLTNHFERIPEDKNPFLAKTTDIECLFAFVTLRATVKTVQRRVNTLPIGVSRGSLRYPSGSSNGIRV